MSSGLGPQTGSLRRVHIVVHYCTYMRHLKQDLLISYYASYRWTINATVDGARVATLCAQRRQCTEMATIRHFQRVTWVLLIYWVHLKCATLKCIREAAWEAHLPFNVFKYCSLFMLPNISFRVRDRTETAHETGRMLLKSVPSGTLNEVLGTNTNLSNLMFYPWLT